jgi:hypothetical protein
MLRCSDTTRLISEGLDRSITLVERLRLGVHLLFCPPCLRFHRATSWLHTVLAAPADARLPAEAHDRIRRALEQAAGNK